MSKKTVFIVIIVAGAIALFLALRGFISDTSADMEKQGAKVERAASEQAPAPGPDGQPKDRVFGDAQKRHARENATRAHERTDQVLKKYETEDP